MKLYHGSTVEIANIDLSKSKPNKDFGRGFYLSADKRQAQRLLPTGLYGEKRIWIEEDAELGKHTAYIQGRRNTYI